jgi:hypothetical protein
MRPDHVWLSHASRHDLKVICDLVRRQQACPLKPTRCIFVFVLSRTYRINTAGHIPKEAVSINRAMVRTQTFDIEDFERIIARPVRPDPLLS